MAQDLSQSAQHVLDAGTTAAQTGASTSDKAVKDAIDDLRAHRGEDEGPAVQALTEIAQLYVRETRARSISHRTIRSYVL